MRRVKSFGLHFPGNLANHLSLFEKPIVEQQFFDQQCRRLSVRLRVSGVGPMSLELTLYSSASLSLSSVV